MGAQVDIFAFVKGRLKYTARRAYVGNISGDLINSVWNKVNETENHCLGYDVYCGRLSADILRAAFHREMSYNPLRFGTGPMSGNMLITKKAKGIINTAQDLVCRFEKLWPNGIAGLIHILDTTDERYRFLREVRDCFKLIARTNMDDFKTADYRNEIIAMFAALTNIQMSPDMRSALQAHCNATAPQRGTRRRIEQLEHEMNHLEKAMIANRTLDPKYLAELQADHDAMKDEWERLSLQVKYKLKKSPTSPAKAAGVTTRPVPSTPVPGPSPACVADMKPRHVTSPNPISTAAENAATADTDGISDAAEREIELLESLTSDHNVDEQFCEYVEKMVGLRLARLNKNFQH